MNSSSHSAFVHLGLAGAIAFAMTGSLSTASAARIDPVLVPPSYSQPSFSPDGQYMAMTVVNDFGRRFVVVTACATMRPTTLMVVDPSLDANSRMKNVTSFAWVGEHDLVLTSDIKEHANALHFATAGKGSVTSGRRDARYTFITAIPKTTAFLVAATPSGNKSGPARVLKISTEDFDREEEVYSCESKTFECVADRAGELRLVKRDEPGAGAAWFARDPAAPDGWKKLNLPSWVRVFGFEYKPDLLVVGGNFGAATPGIHYYSIKEDRVVHTLLSVKNYAADQIATPLFSDGLQALVGLHLDAEHPTSKWIASPMQRLQDSFDRGFADSRNRLAAWSTDLAWMLVERQFGDRPSVFMLVDNRAAKVSPLFTNGGEVDPAQTASVEYFTFMNRANVKLGGYLTKPKTNKGGTLPLVVMLGSDPWNRKHNFGWDNEAQFLAKKGFAILRLNFRGTGQLVESGALEWKDPEDPRKCVEDIVDAVEFLGPNHGIDIKRVGIVGFGGGAGWLAVYAPMAAPDRFRCAAALGGIYDLEEYREPAGADPLRNMGGIPCADEEKGLSIEALRGLSPIASADKIGVPVFVAYGQWSPQRYTDHVAKFQREAKRAGVEFEKTFIGSFYGASLGEHNDLGEYFGALAGFLQKRM